MEDKYEPCPRCGGSGWETVDEHRKMCGFCEGKKVLRVVEPLLPDGVKEQDEKRVIILYG